METIALKITNHIMDTCDVLEEDREIYLYGVDLLLFSVLNIFVLVTAGAFIGRTAETVILLSIFGFLQSVGGGFHAETHLRCFLCMLIGWAFIMWCFPLLLLYSSVSLVIAIIGLSLVFLLAPVEHPNAPASPKKQKMMLKLTRASALIIIFFVLLFMILGRGFEWVCGITATALFASGISMLAFTLRHRGTWTHVQKEAIHE